VEISESRSKIPGKILKCGAGRGWRSFGQIACKINTYYIESRRKETSYLQ